MYGGLIFAILGALVFGFWTVFHQRASNHIDSVFGAILVSLTAVIIGTIFLLPRIKSTVFFKDYFGIIFVFLAGICAFFIDFFALKAYSSGLPISITGPIIIAGSIAVAAIIGFFLGEKITLMKILGLLLVIIGSAVLAAFS
jgi:drug/metabolite transporter (DMT)-like permease